MVKMQARSLAGRQADSTLGGVRGAEEGCCGNWKRVERGNSQGTDKWRGLVEVRNKFINRVAILSNENRKDQ